MTTTLTTAPAHPNGQRPVTLLDEVDERLLAELARDGRASYQALSDQIRLSRTAARTRVRRLQDAGVVRVLAAVHPALTGTATIAHLFLDVDGPARHVAALIGGRAAAWSVTLTGGDRPVLAQLRVPGDAELAAEIEAVRALPGVRTASTWRATRVIRDTHSIPGAPPQICLGHLDWRLIRELVADGRASYTRLAVVAGLSQAAARARVLRLLQAGVITITARVDRGPRESAALGLQARVGAQAGCARLADLPGVTYLAAGWGPHDLLAEVQAATRADLLARIEAIRAIPGLHLDKTWPYLQHTHAAADGDR